MHVSARNACIKRHGQNGYTEYTKCIYAGDASHKFGMRLGHALATSARFKRALKTKTRYFDSCSNVESNAIYHSQQTHTAPKQRRSPFKTFKSFKPFDAQDAHAAQDAHDAHASPVESACDVLHAVRSICSNASAVLAQSTGSTTVYSIVSLSLLDRLVSRSRLSGPPHPRNKKTLIGY